MAGALRALVSRSSALSLGGRPLGPLTGLRAIAVVGASCAGKSTLVGELHALARAGAIDVPARYVTRPRRMNESPGENLHVTSAVFANLVARGALGLRWSRPMEGGRTERYGFRPVAPGRLAVYSANNALYAHPRGVEPVGALEEVLLVGVEAPEAVRAERMRRRSPDLCLARPDEVAFRLRDSAGPVAPNVHVVVHNDGEREASARREFAALVEFVVAGARGGAEHRVHRAGGAR